MIDTKEYILDLSMPEKVSLFNELYSELAGHGTEGDTELAHVNTFEARLLKSIGGSGTINEITGLRQFGGGGQPAPPAQQSVTQTTEFPPELRPFISDILGEAQAEFQREKQEGFLPFPGPQIASFTPEQQAAFETGRQQFTGFAGTPLAAGETYARPALASTALGTSEVGTEDIGRRMDPFLQNVVDIAKREAIRDEEAAVQGRAAQAVGAGSFGGTRQALVESEAERNLAERLGDIQARGLSTAFQNAQQAAEAQRQRELAGGRQFAALGDIAGQRARADIGGLAGIGETQQQRRQQALDIARQEFGQEQVFPAQTLGKYQSIVRGFPYQMGFTEQRQQTIPTPSLAQTLGGGLQGAAGLYGMFGGFGGGGATGGRVGNIVGRQGGGLVSLQGGGVPTAPTTGGVPQVPLGAQKMVPHLMKMYESNPQFKNKIDQDIQRMVPQVQGVNLGAGGAQTNLGTAGAPPFTGKGGGLVSLEGGTGNTTVAGSWQDRVFNRPESELEKEHAKLLGETREYFKSLPTKEERLERADKRRMQALYASLIAGGAGILGADPQKGYAAAVGEGFKAGLPIAAEGMEGYYDALDAADVTEVQNKIQELSLVRDAVTDERQKAAIDRDLITLAASTGLLDDKTPDFNIAEVESRIASRLGLNLNNLGPSEQIMLTTIADQAMNMVDEKAQAGQRAYNAGQTRKEVFAAIDQIIKDKGITPDNLTTILEQQGKDLETAIFDTDDTETVEQADEKVDVRNLASVPPSSELEYLDAEIARLEEEIAGIPERASTSQRSTLRKLQEEKEMIQGETSEERQLRKEELRQEIERLNSLLERGLSGRGKVVKENKLRERITELTTQLKRIR